MAKCNACGCTGDKFDHEKNDWVTPREDCPECKGTGELPGDD